MSTNHDHAPRRYLFALVDGGGTVPPELGAVRRLVERGHDVTVLAEDSMRRGRASLGATFRPWVQAPNRPSRLPEHDPYHDWECKNPLELFSRLLDRQFVGPAPGYAADVTAAIADHRPDLVVCSFFAYGAMVAAEAAGIPFDVLMPNVYLLPARGMPPLGLGVKPAAGSLGRGRDRLVTASSPASGTRACPASTSCAPSLGLEPLDSFFDQVHQAHRQLVLTSPDFDFPGRAARHVRYVGAVLDDPAWAAGRSVDDRPRVTTRSCWWRCRRRSRTRPPACSGSSTRWARCRCEAIVTTGPALDPDALTRPRPTSRSSPPRRTRRCCRTRAAVVTHGGHGTVVRTLAADVPMVDPATTGVTRPTTPPVSPHGAPGVKRTARQAAAIATAVQRLLDDPAFALGARQLGESIRRDAASGRAGRRARDGSDHGARRGTVQPGGLSDARPSKGDHLSWARTVDGHCPDGPVG